MAQRWATATTLAVFAGGVAGTLLRALLLEGWPPPADAWPWPTFVANVGGAFLVGAVVARGWHRAALGTGFCGALTTFSTLQLELVHMLDARRTGLAAAYAGASLALGLVAVRAGRRWTA